MPSAVRPNFGLLELCTACAFLVIVLGLTVSLARRVRSVDSQAAFFEQLAILNSALARHGIPNELALFGENADEDEVRNATVVHASALRNAESWTGPLGLDAAAGFDPWGSPVVLIDGPNPRLGMAPHLNAFFMSAGPDGRYFTLSDNVYSYDASFAANPPAPTTGHSE